MSARGAIGVLRAVDAEFASEGQAAFQGAFVAAPACEGAKPGYIFRTGPRGLGWYVDPLGSLAGQQDAPAAPAAPATKDGGELLAVRPRRRRRHPRGAR